MGEQNWRLTWDLEIEPRTEFALSKVGCRAKCEGRGQAESQRKLRKFPFRTRPLPTTLHTHQNATSLPTTCGTKRQRPLARPGWGSPCSLGCGTSTHPPPSFRPIIGWWAARTPAPPPPPGKHLWPFSFDDSALMTLENAYNETPCPRGKLRCRGGPKPLDEMPNTSKHWQILAETGKHGQTLANIDPGPSRISNHSP